MLNQPEATLHYSQCANTFAGFLKSNTSRHFVVLRQQNTTRNKKPSYKDIIKPRSISLHNTELLYEKKGTNIA
jgi:hypothetical protein